MPNKESHPDQRQPAGGQQRKVVDKPIIAQGGDITQYTKPINPAKAYLLGYRAALLNLNQHISEYNRLSSQYDRIQRNYDRATKATSSLTAVRLSGTPDHDGMANAVLDIVDLKRQIAQRKGECDGTLDWLLDDMQRLAEAGKERLETIAKVADHRLQLVLYMRYFLPKTTWIQLAHQLSAITQQHCGEDNVYKLHGYALAEVKKIIGKNNWDSKAMKEGNGDDR